MNTEQMRAAVLSVYPGWKAIKQMPEPQVLRIFKRLQQEKKIKL